jgi:cyclopropane fatty-acyl-phospholipid synthase-like methyltransferase
MANIWDQRYAGEEYHFGTEPNAFLLSQQHWLQAGMSCLAVADGEGRNGVWLAQQGLDVLSVDASPVALAKARRLASERGVSVRFELVDLLQSEVPVPRNAEGGAAGYDVVAGIFIQFVPPAQRAAMFDGIKRALKPGGLLLLQGYTPRQLEYRTGGPSQAENLYTEALLRELFADMDILHLAEHDSHISEGAGHHGMSALIDLVARK